MDNTCGYVCPQCEGRGFLDNFSDCNWCTDNPITNNSEIIEIYHNNKCGKSRNALAILIEKNIDFKVIEYLKNPLTTNQIKVLLNKLNITAFDLIRKEEAIYKENYKGRHFTENEWIAVLAQNPILIERPIVVNGTKAIIGRPPEKVLAIL
jgi:arsenate reductase